MKAILIDSINEEVSMVKVDGSLDDIYRLLNCTNFDVVPVRFKNNDAIYCDGEGLLTLTPETKFFFYEGSYQPIAGNGLIVGTDEEGDTVDVKTSVTEAKKKVMFLNMGQVQELARRGLF